MIKNKSKEEIEAANAEAIYHIREIVDGFTIDENIDESLLEEIRRRLVDCFYSGSEFAQSKMKSFRSDEVVK